VTEIRDPAVGATNLAERRRELLDRLLREEMGDALRQDDAITPRDVAGEVPLSFAQQRLWFLDQLEPGSPAYNIPAAVRLRGRLDATMLDRSLAEVARRHEILRTTFGAADGRPFQRIGPAVPLPCRRADLRDIPEVEREAALSALARDEARRAFDLAAGPLIRIALARTGDDEHVLFVTMHHAISDGWSMGVFVRELGALYEAFTEARPSPLPELPIQYADFTWWQRRTLSEERIEELLRYWRPRLSGPLPVLQLPTDRPRPAIRTHAGAYRFAALPRSLGDRIAALGRQEGVTPFMTFLAAFDVLLSRHSGQHDILVGSPIANRGRTELESLIGFFANTIVLRADLSGNPRFRELLARTREATLGAYAHQDLPFEKLVEEIQPERDRSRSPLFQVAFVLQNAPMPELELSGLKVGSLEMDSGTAKFDLTLCLAEGEDGWHASLEYNTDLFDDATAERMLARLQRLLEGIVENPDARIAALPIVPEEERRLLMDASNARPAEFPQDACLHTLFERVAADRSGRVAVVCGRESLTYGELDRRANRLAYRLRASGVGPEVLVALSTERSVDMIVGILGILKAGGAYVPLDPSYPEERRALILEDSGTRVLVTQRQLLDRQPSGGLTTVLIDADDPEPLEIDAGIDVPTETTAYVIYTSGSTGRPKGVPVSHASVARIFEATRPWFRFDASDVWTLFHSYAFDFSVWELWGALLHGGRLVIVPRETSRDPQAFDALCRRERVTVLNQTPSFFRQLARADEALPDDGDRSLRLVIFGGEALELQSLRPWFLRHGDERPVLVNMYGITETTIHVTYRPIAAADLDRTLGSVVGVPIPDLEVHVLDENLELSPIGVPGELCVGGDGLTRGYLGSPDKTAERFVPDPFGTRPGRRLYRSGDLARRLANAELEYLGRIDHQVKIRGFRVEPGEIEAALDTHPQVRESCVMAIESGGDDRRLVAYVVPSSGSTPSLEELRRHLELKLPAYMVPATILVLDALPLSAHGKVDRARLPLPDGTRPDLERAYVEPATATELILGRIWSEVLGVERPGVHDNFFTLGGDSIRSIQVVAKARERGLDASVAAVFEHQTIAALARHLATRESRLETGVRGGVHGLGLGDELRRLPEGVEDAYPLSRLQEGFVYHSEYSDDYVIYATSVYLRAALDVDALQRAVDRVVRRHAMLRTSFDFTSFSEPMQLVHRDARVPLAVVDLRHLTREDQDRFMATWLDGELLHRFAWTSCPLVRFHVHRRADDEFQFTVSEPFFDGWSLASLLTEVFESYFRLSIGDELQDGPPLRATYKDFVMLERESLRSEESRRYWDRRLAEVAAGTLPVRSGSRDVGAKRACPVGRVQVPIPEDVSTRLVALARLEGVPIKDVLLAGHLKVLGSITGRSEVITGLIQNGRPEQDDGEQVLGLFLNTIPLRVDLRRESWRELVRRAFDAEVDSLPHRRFPLAELQRLYGPQPLFDTCFNYTNFHVYERLSGIEGLEVLDYVGSEQTYFALTTQFNLDHDSKRVSLALDYRCSELDREQVEEIGRRYARVLAAMAEHPEAPHDTLSVLSHTERRLLTREWSGSSARIATDGTVHGLFEARVRRAPDALAAVHGGSRCTYGELNSRANRLARHLRERGVGPDVLVGVCLDRNLDIVVALLGILKAGGAYVPLDPAYPKERLEFTVEDSEMPVVVTHDRLVEILPPNRANLVRIDADARAIDRCDPDDLGISIDPEQLAYVLYTSGSTGRPKGASLRHRGVVAMLRWADGVYGDDELRGVLASTSLCFDPSVLEIFLPLSRGGAVVVAESVLDLPTLPAREEVTLVSTVSSAIDELLRSGGIPDSVLVVNLAGEPLKSALVKRIYERGTIRRVWNLYGLTEDSVYSTAEPVAPDSPGELASIGRPVPGTHVYLLDPFFQPVPPGVPGEIHVGGEGLPRGYVNRPELTAEKFVPDPFGEAPGARLHRTGDLARFRADGSLEFLGRIDNQVKVRGFRIELGEVEAVLGQHPAVRQVLATVWEVEPGERILLAYLVPTGPHVPASVLREFLKERLPEFMTPSAFLWLDGFPLTPNGKLDRRRLPAPERGEFVGRKTYVAPRTPVEDLLAGIWQRTFRVDRIGVHDGFFDLGGHSLTATQIVSRARDAFRVELPLRALFEEPTIAGLAGRIETLLREGTGDSVPEIRPAERGNELPLSFAQQRLWFLDQLEPHSPFYNVPVALRLAGALDVSALERTIEEVLRRHDGLRTAFASERGRPNQVVHPPAAFRLHVEDLLMQPEADRETEVERHVAAEAVRPFELATGPLFRASLVRVRPDDHVVLLTMHHIVSDGWSIGLLVREVAELYDAFSHGRPSPLAELAIQYADFAVWQRSWLRGAVLESQLGYWTHRLGGAPATLDLPTDLSRPPVQTHRGALRVLELSRDLSDALANLARREGATLFMTLLAAFDVLLHRLSGATDIVVGTPIANRNRSEIEGLIGFFVNTLVLRTDLSGDPTFRKVLARVREAALGAYAHQDLPFERLVEAVPSKRDLSRAPLFQVMFDLHNEPMPVPSLSGLTVTVQTEHTGTAKFDLTLTLTESPEGLVGSLEYATDLFLPATIERMARQLETLLGGIVADADCRISELPLMSGAERLSTVEMARGPRLERGDLGDIGDLLAKRVAGAPDAPAVTCGEVTLSYRELARRTQNLASTLRDRGVGIESRVAVGAERSIEAIVAMLAVLEAGGAYVPFDPAYPEERSASTLRDARPSVVIARSGVAGRLGASEVPVILLDGEVSVPRSGEERFAPSRPIDRAAYVLYTSGSMGTPKGVVVSHRNLVESTLARMAYYREPVERFLMVPSFAFDSSVAGLFWTLCSGGTLNVLPEGAHREPRRLVEAIASGAITHVLLLPSLYARVLEESRAGELASLRVVVVAGETCPVDLVARHLAALPTVALYNEYGPTEGTVWASVFDCRDVNEQRSVPIGGPIAGVELHLLDAGLEPVPVGVVGEICLGGAGVARGYLGRPDETALRFVPDPFGSRIGGRLYRTGDLGRRLPGGDVEFFGRNDLQVKLRGYRIEPEEIEAALRSHPDVGAGAVKVWQEGGEARLVAYISPREGVTPRPSALRAHLKRLLPDYMIPSTFVVGDLPWTPSGKVDRSALPAPERDRSGVDAPFLAPRTPTEEVIAGVWREVLGVFRLGVEDDFFELGGHSLTATQVLSRVREIFDIELPLRTIFESPTPAEFAEALMVAVGDRAAVDETARWIVRVASMSDDEVGRLLESKTLDRHREEAP
jgi:amino acid adenylation domain-containing protein